MTTTQQKLLQIARAIKGGCRFASFNYAKYDKNGNLIENRKRKVMLNVKLAPSFEKRGQPLKGKGSWMSGKRYGSNGVFVKKDDKFYISGLDTEEKSANGVVGRNKMFIVDQISNISGSKE